MLGALPDQNQRELFRPLPAYLIDLRHELALPANRVDRNYFQTEFSPLYATGGQPGVPVRLMVGCLLLKQMKNLGDQTLAKEWIENPYLQYFCGMRCFEHRFPFDPSDFFHFRKWIGEAGCEKILKYNVRLHYEGKGRHLTNASWHVSDTTVPENNTTFPTDAKLCKKVIEHCNRIAEQEGIKLRLSYRRGSKQLVRDLERKLSEPPKVVRREPMALYQRVVHQRPQDKDKIYSLHTPSCGVSAKGKRTSDMSLGTK